VLLENYNFEVIDLGKNVEPSLVAQTVLNENTRLAGLSALMTTTVVYMEETTKLLREKAPGCRVDSGICRYNRRRFLRKRRHGQRPLCRVLVKSAGIM
jgi:hypothetical protein